MIYDRREKSARTSKDIDAERAAAACQPAGWHRKLLRAVSLLRAKLRKGRDLEVGPGREYERLSEAMDAAKPGDTIKCLPPEARGVPLLKNTLDIERQIEVSDNVADAFARGREIIAERKKKEKEAREQRAGKLKVIDAYTDCPAKDAAEGAVVADTAAGIATWPHGNTVGLTLDEQLWRSEAEYTITAGNIRDVISKKDDTAISD